MDNTGKLAEIHFLEKGKSRNANRMGGHKPCVGLKAASLLPGYHYEARSISKYENNETE